MFLFIDHFLYPSHRSHLVLMGALGGKCCLIPSFHLQTKRGSDIFLKNPQRAWRLQFDSRNNCLYFCHCKSQGKDIHTRQLGNWPMYVLIVNVDSYPRNKKVKCVALWKSVLLILGTCRLCPICPKQNQVV